MENNSQILQLCRLCLDKDSVNIPIFEEPGDIRQIYLKISSCLPVKVSRDDRLPKKICDGCSHKLDLVYEFRNTSVSAEKQLLEWLDDTNLISETVAKSTQHSLETNTQQNRPSETQVKQEEIDPSDIQKEEDEDDDKNYLFEQSFQDSSAAPGPSATTDVAEEEEEEPPPPKRAKRTAAVKAAIAMDQSDDDDEDDLGEPLTKVEDESDESEGDDQEAPFVDVPSTSADDQPGPSGVGKEGEAPYFDTSILNNLIYGPGISITPVHSDPAVQYYTCSQPGNSFKNFNGVHDLVKTTANSSLSSSELNVKCNEKFNSNPIMSSLLNPPFTDVSGSKFPLLEASLIKSTDSTNILEYLKKDAKKKKSEKAKTVEKIQSTTPVELDEPIHCEICNETYKNNVAFALHSEKHSEDGKFNCHLCDYKNASKYHIEMHIRAHEGTTKYKCEICGKAFTVSTHAIEHKYFHTGEKPFQCEICGKHFMFSWFLTSHRRTQHWEIMTGSPLVKYDCKICNKHYTSSTGLKRHNYSKHNASGVDASVLCDICGKRLSNKEKLKFHRRIHTGYKPFTCDICSKSFSRKEQLKEHERVHTGEKPYICKFCGKGFTQRSPLRIHERTHTGERPYTCLICGKGFISKGVMDTHMKTCSATQISFS